MQGTISLFDKIWPCKSKSRSPRLHEFPCSNNGFFYHTCREAPPTPKTQRLWILYPSRKAYSTSPLRADIYAVLKMTEAFERTRTSRLNDTLTYVRSRPSHRGITHALLRLYEYERINVFVIARLNHREERQRASPASARIMRAPPQEWRWEVC